LYGIPIHAWNENFFKLCVLDCDSFLRTDNCSLNRERFDYARVLVSTTSLDVVNVTEQLIVDGTSVDIKIVEEFGFNIADDVCLYDVDDNSESDNQEHADMYEDIAADKNVDMLADKIVQDLVDMEDLNTTDVNGLLPENVAITASAAVQNKQSAESEQPASPTCSEQSDSVNVEITASAVVHNKQSAEYEQPASPTCSEQTVNVSENAEELCMKHGTELAISKRGPSLQEKGVEVSVERESMNSVVGTEACTAVGASSKQKKKNYIVLFE
jgi:hypothetical protein